MKCAAGGLRQVWHTGIEVACMMAKSAPCVVFVLLFLTAGQVRVISGAVW